MVRIGAILDIREVIRPTITEQLSVNLDWSRARNIVNRSCKPIF